MKITIVNGQGHKGSTYRIGKMLAEQVEKNAEITEFFLPTDLNHFCKGCYRCIENDADCPYYAEKKKITDSIEAADLIIFATPCYCMLPSAPLKAFIDLTFTYWMPHRPRECMFSKKAVVISTAAGIGTAQAMKGVKRTLFYWGIPYIKSYGISIQAKSWDEISDAKKAKIEKDIAALARKINRVKTPKVGIKTKFMFNMMGNMQKAGLGSSPVEKQYWQENGWLDKKRPWKKEK